MIDAGAIVMDDRPPEVTAAFAATETGRSLHMKPDPPPEPLEEQPQPKRPWDARLNNWVLKTAGLVSKLGFIGYVRWKVVGRIIWVLRKLWKFRLWLHSVRLYRRFLKSDPVTEDVFDERMAICERCIDWHLELEPNDPRCEDPDVPPGLYCTACICPVVERALLTNKNGREGHRCPKGYHEGSKPDPYAKQTCNSASCVEKRSENHGMELLPGNRTGGSAGVQGNGRRHARR